MADDDFDISGLAAYLHMMPAQVSRLADRGKLPGRRIAGHWRFSRPEISQWLETRIGGSDEDELAEMETTLRRIDQVGVDLGELLLEDAIAVPLQARTPASVIRAMCQLAASTGMLWDPERLADAVREREAMASTAMEHGLAMLHPRRPQPQILGQAIIGLGITSGGIPFGGRGGLTDVFFLIAATSDHEYLKILTRLSRIAYDAAFIDALRSVADPVDARRLILHRDAAIHM